MNVQRFDSTPVTSTPQIGEQRPPIDLNRHIALLRRRARLIGAVFLLVFGLALVFTFQIRPRFTADAEVMLDPRQEKVTNVQDVLSGLPADTTGVDTEVEVLKSRNLAEKVVAALGLGRDSEFNVDLREKSFWSSFTPTKYSDSSAEEAAKSHNRVVDKVIKELRVTRSGLTYVIKVSFTSQSANKASLIANAFADNYLLEQLDAKFDATKRASDWLNSRLSTLKGQVEVAESAVAQYKASHGLMGLSTAEGATIAQQEVSGLNTQLATARAQQAEAEANFETAKQQLAKGSSGDDLGASLNSPVINELRQQRAQISSQVADMAGRLGPRHPEMLKAQRQLADIDAQIQSEIKRITSNLEAQAQVARQRTSSLAGSLSNSRSTLASNGAASVALNDLQRNADSLAALYQTYLDRFKQTSNQEGIAQSDSRVVSRAKIPTSPSYPDKPLNLSLGALLAALSALIALFLMESLENGLYTSEDVEKLIGTPHLGSVPQLRSVLDHESKKSGATVPFQYVLDKPLSTFAESFRSLKTSILHSKVGIIQVVAITSSLPGEGKTTTCICLGRVCAAGGTSTVIVDCDLRRRTVNRIFESDPKVGLLEVLLGTATLDEALVFDEQSGAWFLPLANHTFTPRDVFESTAMDNLLATLRSRFNIVILDTAPVLPVNDTRVLAPKADVTVFLAQWRKSPRKAVEAALSQLKSVDADVIGIALTQVDMKEQARSGYGDSSYYYKSYRQYYQAY